MSRFLGPGDIAIIVIDNVEYPMLISSVSPDRIIANKYTLIRINNEWQVQDYDLHHTVKFAVTYREQLLSGIEDVDRLILLELDYRSLLAACTSDSYTNKICRNDYFWRQKVEHDMGYEVMINKLPGMSYREQYRTLIDGMTEDDAIRNGRLDHLILNDHYLNQSDVALAAGYGWINILQWAEADGVLIDKRTANEAAAGGRINVLEWLFEKGIYPDDGGFIFAAANSRKNIINWLLNHGITPIDPRRIANKMVIEGNVNMLEWLKFKGMIPDAKAAAWAQINGTKDVVRWLNEQGIYPDPSGYRGMIW